MPAYALLLRPAANHLYSKGAAALNQAELSVLNERPEALLDAALDGWIGAMKPGAAIGLSWNTKVLARNELVELLGRHGLERARATRRSNIASTTRSRATSWSQ